MDVSDLLDIKAICDAGSYRKAAETLGVTQPTLSNRIAYLEGKLGARLFDREHGRSRPTELATLIANRAGIIGREAALLSKDIVRLAAGQAEAAGPHLVPLRPSTSAMSCRPGGFPPIHCAALSAPRANCSREVARWVSSSRSPSPQK